MRFPWSALREPAVRVRAAGVVDVIRGCVRRCARAEKQRQQQEQQSASFACVVHGEVVCGEWLRDCGDFMQRRCGDRREILLRTPRAQKKSARASGKKLTSI